MGEEEGEQEADPGSSQRAGGAGAQGSSGEGGPAPEGSGPGGGSPGAGGRGATPRGPSSGSAEAAGSPRSGQEVRVCRPQLSAPGPEDPLAGERPVNARGANSRQKFQTGLESPPKNASSPAPAPRSPSQAPGSRPRRSRPRKRRRPRPRPALSPRRRSAARRRPGRRWLRAALPPGLPDAAELQTRSRPPRPSLGGPHFPGSKGSSHRVLPRTCRPGRPPPLGRAGSPCVLRGPDGADARHIPQTRGTPGSGSGNQKTRTPCRHRAGASGLPPPR